MEDKNNKNEDRDFQELWNNLMNKADEDLYNHRKRKLAEKKNDEEKMIDPFMTSMDIGDREKENNRNRITK